MSLKKKNIVIVLIFILAVFAAPLLLVYPIFNGIQKNSAEFIEARKKIITAEQDLQNLERVQKFYKTMEPDLVKSEALFINQEFPVAFIRFLEKTAFDSGVSMDVSAVTAPKTEKNLWPSANFQLNLLCYLPNCLRFVEKIETAPYLIEIRNFVIRKALQQGLPSEAILADNATADILIRVYSK